MNRSEIKMDRNYDISSHGSLRREQKMSKEYIDNVKTKSKDEPTFNDTEHHLEELDQINY